MATKYLQILSLKFGQVMFNSLVFTWKRNFEVKFGIFSILVTQINDLESYSDIYLFKISYDKKCEKGFTNVSSHNQENILQDLSDFASV